jgi:hypothetical protein
MIASQILPLLPLLLLLVFDAYCLVDLIEADRVRYFPKLSWAILICITSPLGGIAYLILGKVA